MASLDRFVDAQRATYPQALAELRGGRKTSHWMWYVFPQIAGLGYSATARFYAVVDRDEAAAYLAHPLLGVRLAESTEAVMGWASRRDIETILGGIDALKFGSSMTLFEAVGARFCAAPIEAFRGGTRDDHTLRLLETQSPVI